MEKYDRGNRNKGPYMLSFVEKSIHRTVISETARTTTNLLERYRQEFFAGIQVINLDMIHYCSLRLILSKQL